MIKIWPLEQSDVNWRRRNFTESDVTDLLQQKIDLVYTFGGDGTLLTLLKALYENNDSLEIPKIAAFNMVSIFFLFYVFVYDF